MGLFDIRTHQQDDILDRIAEELQLDSTRHERAKTAYNAVGSWIDSDPDFFSNLEFEIYPQGSYRIGTTVKPYGKEEYDLDFVVHIRALYYLHTPEKIYEKLRGRIMEHEFYRGIAEPKNRCIRINYAGDFHMDILPGCIEFEFDNNRLKVPDKSRASWVASNPRGFADWFESKYILQSEILLEKAYSIEELPEQEKAKFKQPLQRAVQLLKRFRDIHFTSNPKLATSSIILTTLAGHLYRGEPSIYEAFDGIIERVWELVCNSNGKIDIINPANKDEKFSDKWEDNPALFDSFLEYANTLHTAWNQFKSNSTVDEGGNALKALFGDSVVNKAFTAQSDLINFRRQGPNLGIIRNSGQLTRVMNSSPTLSNIKTNTFYGDRG
jgi:hypothetical protein